MARASIRLIPLLFALILGGCSSSGGDNCNAAGVLLGICVLAAGGGGPVLVPASVADAANVDEGGAVVIDVNDNDTPGTGATPVTGVTQPANGTVVITDAAAGTVTYTPAAGFSGIDTFSYTITDTNGATSTAIVTVTVADLNPVNTTLQGLTQRATFNTTNAVLAAMPQESALLPRATTDSRITIGPLADPSFDWDILLGNGGAGINIDTTASYVGAFAGNDGLMNWWGGSLDTVPPAHGSLDPILVPSGHPHAPFDVDDPATPAFDESDPANFLAQSIHFVALGIGVPGPGGTGLSFANYGIWEVEGGNIFGTSYVGGAFSFGILTPGSSVPTIGGGVFNGTMVGLYSPATAPGALTNVQSTLTGTATLTADFAAGTVAADFTNITAMSAFGTFLPRNLFGAGPAGTFVNIHADATIAGNNFTGAATTVATPGATVIPAGAPLTGEIDGNFFGPAAQEVGGVVRLGNPGGAQVITSFGATQ